MQSAMCGKKVQWRVTSLCAICLGLACTLVYYLCIYWMLSGENKSDIHLDDTNPRARIHTDKSPISNFSRYKEDFQPLRGDVLVFFHIQKTGGTTFNSHLVRLSTHPPCNCWSDPPEEGSCRCRTAEGYIWLFSRFTTSSSCGVHPPLPDLTVCVPRFLAEAEGYDEGEKHRFLYTTILRDPVRRYLSEWKHIQKVGPWPSRCAAGNPVESCVKDLKNEPIGFKDFITCPGNPANNRQVRMLSTYATDQCGSVSVDADMLQRAKTSLEKLSFFGLTEDQDNTQKLFEWTYGVTFNSKFQRANDSVADQVLERSLDDSDVALVRKENNLDIDLYKFAENLFYERLKLAQNGRMN